MDYAFGVILKGCDAQQKPETFGFFLFYFPCLQKQAFDAGKQKSQTILSGFFWSGWQDSNLRPPAPKAGAITGLRYTPRNVNSCSPLFPTYRFSNLTFQVARFRAEFIPHEFIRTTAGLYPETAIAVNSFLNFWCSGGFIRRSPPVFYNALQR